MQAADIKKDCNSFTVRVAIGMFVLGLWGITLPSFLSGTGLLCLLWFSFSVSLSSLFLHGIFFWGGWRFVEICGFLLGVIFMFLFYCFFVVWWVYFFYIFLAYCSCSPLASYLSVVDKSFFFWCVYFLFAGILL